MIEIQGKKFYKPSEVASLGLITNSKGNRDYGFVVRLIRNGRPTATQWNEKEKAPYYVVSEEEINSYNERIVQGDK